MGRGVDHEKGPYKQQIQGGLHTLLHSCLPWPHPHVYSTYGPSRDDTSRYLSTWLKSVGLLLLYGLTLVTAHPWSPNPKQPWILVMWLDKILKTIPCKVVDGLRRGANSFQRVGTQKPQIERD